MKIYDSILDYIITKIKVLRNLDGSDACQSLVALLYALYGEYFGDSNKQQTATDILSKLLASTNDSPWFFHGEQSLYWTLQLLNKKGLLSMTSSLHERIIRFISRFEVSWGQVPYNLYPHKFQWGDSMLLSQMWNNDDSYCRYFIEELLIMRIERAEDALNRVRNNIEAESYLNLLGCCYLIKFCIDHNIYPYKAKELADKILIISFSSPTNIRLCIQNVLGVSSEPIHEMSMYQLGLYSVLFNSPSMFQPNHVQIHNTLGNYSTNDLFGYGLGLLNQLV